MSRSRTPTKSRAKAQKPAKPSPIEFTNDDELPSTCSGGGPVIAIPAEHAAGWRGTTPPKGAKVPKGWTWGDSGGPETDYDRACDVSEDAVGMFPIHELAVGTGRALVLDSELTTTWIPAADGGVIARGYEVSDDADELRAAVPTKGWKPFAAPLALVDGRIFLFDSAYEGARNPDKIDADDGVAVAMLGAGTYDLSYVTKGNCDFVRFARQGAATAAPTASRKSAAKPARAKPRGRAPLDSRAR
jgi:hypothetical protein